MEIENFPTAEELDGYEPAKPEPTTDIDEPAALAEVVYLDDSAWRYGFPSYEANIAEVNLELETDLEVWHQQTYPDTCAIVCQEFVLDQLTGEDFSENELRSEATASGSYIPGGGTPAECVGD